MGIINIYILEAQSNSITTRPTGQPDFFRYIGVLVLFSDCKPYAAATAIKNQKYIA